MKQAKLCLAQWFVDEAGRCKCTYWLGVLRPHQNWKHVFFMRKFERWIARILPWWPPNFIWFLEITSSKAPRHYIVICWKIPFHNFRSCSFRIVFPLFWANFWPFAQAVHVHCSTVGFAPGWFWMIQSAFTRQEIPLGSWWYTHLVPLVGISFSQPPPEGRYGGAVSVVGGPHGPAAWKYHSETIMPKWNCIEISLIVVFLQSVNFCR